MTSMKLSKDLIKQDSNRHPKFYACTSCKVKITISLRQLGNRLIVSQVPAALRRGRKNLVGWSVGRSAMNFYCYCFVARYKLLLPSSEEGFSFPFGFLGDMARL